MSNILVTGARGFVGRHFIEYCIEKHPSYNFIGLTHSIPQEEDGKFPCELVYYPFHVGSSLERYKPEIIFHFGGIASPQNKDFNQVWECNVNWTKNLLSNCAGAKIVFLSTADIESFPSYYGQSCNTYYSASKLACEGIIESFFEENKIPACSIVRPVGILGPNLTHGVVKKIIEEVKTKPECNLMYNARRPYIDIKSLCYYLSVYIQVDFINKYKRTLSNKDNVSLEEIGNICNDVFNTNCKINFKYNSFADNYVAPTQHFGQRSTREIVTETVKEYNV